MALSNHHYSLSELFDKALKIGGNTHTREDIAAGIKSGRFQYWGDEDCCLVTEIVEYPQKKTLHLFIAAGDLSKLLENYLPKIKKFAQENGCSALTSVSRKGFLKRFPAYGFRPKCITFELALEGSI